MCMCVCVCVYVYVCMCMCVLDEISRSVILGGWRVVVICGMGLEEGERGGYG